jgi:hypothetical protein
MSSTTGTDATANISPKPPAPLYPDVPWWSVLITSIVFIFLGILIGVKMGAVDKSTLAGVVPGGIGALAVDTIAYVPHILLLFGVLADMFTLDGVWSIPSLVGLLSIFANAAFEYFWKGIDELFKTTKAALNAAAGKEVEAPQSGKGRERRQKGGEKTLFKSYTETTGCEVQGFGVFNSPYAPQTLVVTATVFSYYVFDLIQNRGWVNSIAGILAFLLLYIAEVFVIDMQSDSVGCRVPGATDGPDVTAIGQGIRAFFEGLLFGGISYGVVQTYAPTRLPSSTISPFPRKTVDDLTAGPDGRMYDKDGYPYIVLPNGQAVPDVSDAVSRAAFGAIAGEATGNIMSLASDCPGAPTACPR